MISDSLGNYLAGLIDGEGSFHIGVNSRRRSSRYSSIGCQFTLSLRLDDIGILRELQLATSWGRVYACRRSGLAQHPHARWEIFRKSECRGLVSLLDRCPLRAKKKRDFAIWREAVLLWCAHRPANTASGRTPAPFREQFLTLHNELVRIRNFETAGEAGTDIVPEMPPPQLILLKAVDA